MMASNQIRESRNLKLKVIHWSVIQALNGENIGQTIRSDFQLAISFRAIPRTTTYLLKPLNPHFIPH